MSGHSCTIQANVVVGSVHVFIKLTAYVCCFAFSFSHFRKSIPPVAGAEASWGALGQSFSRCLAYIRLLPDYSFLSVLPSCIVYSTMAFKNFLSLIPVLSVAIMSVRTVSGAFQLTCASCGMLLQPYLRPHPERVF